MDINRNNIEEIILGMAEIVAENRELREANKSLIRDNEWYKQVFHEWLKQDRDTTELFLDLSYQSMINTTNLCNTIKGR